MNKTQVFILAAQKIKGWQEEQSHPLLTKKAPNGERILDMSLKLLCHNKIKPRNINIIAGYGYQSIKKEYSKHKALLNPDWETQNVGGSIIFSLKFWNGGNVLFVYGDTLFNNSVFERVLEDKNKDKIAESFSKKTEGNIETIKDILGNSNLNQFTGLTYLTKNTTKKLKAFLETNVKKNEKHRFSKLLREFLKHHKKLKINTIDATGMWTEIDSKENFAKFLFGSKAETLQRITPFVKRSKILPQVHFDFKEWQDAPEKIMSKIKKLKTKKLIVRSSSLDEDSWEHSNAGAFLSVKDIDTNNIKLLQKSINKVFSSYTSGNKKNQVLVQPFINNPYMSGVVFSRTLEEGLPYYTLSYDETTTKTDTITSGSTNDIVTLHVYRQSTLKKATAIQKKIILAVQELEKLFNFTSLDLEFIVDSKLEIKFVQARPITSHNKLIDDMDFGINFSRLQEFLKNKLSKKEGLCGDYTILSDMTDWNPAEMIGVKPKNLSLSLYESLITDSSWRESRGLLGYANPKNEKLMVTIAGHPYIDIRNSLVSLTPSLISESLRKKVVNHYLSKLKNNLSLHDKIEFKIAITCYTPDFVKQSKELVEAGFSKKQIHNFEEKLKALTKEIVSQQKFSIKSLLEQTIKLDQLREEYSKQKIETHQIPEVLSALMSECKANGTIPFAILARFAFIGTSFINSFEQNGIISPNSKADFLSSIDTVATKMHQEIKRVYKNKAYLKKFLEGYGHLRPSTYDIEVDTYKENYKAYFPKTPSQSLSSASSNFSFAKTELDKIQASVSNLGVQAEDLISFIRESVKAREESKFMFTKTLSYILDLTKKYGEHYGISRSEMSYININDLTRMVNLGITINIRDYLKQTISINKKAFTKSHELITPDIITRPEDLDIIIKDERLPNFVTSKSVSGHKVLLKGSNNTESLKEKILMIEGADPGYDWIFLHGIKGLITKYGGAASHMTIRCAEFNLPAAIGCGEKIYEDLKRANKIKLDCEKMNILILE